MPYGYRFDFSPERREERNQAIKENRTKALKILDREKEKIEKDRDIVPPTWEEERRATQEQNYKKKHPVLTFLKKDLLGSNRKEQPLSIEQQVEDLRHDEHTLYNFIWEELTYIHELERTKRDLVNHLKYKFQEMGNLEILPLQRNLDRAKEKCKKQKEALNSAKEKLQQEVKEKYNRDLESEINTFKLYPFITDIDDKDLQNAVENYIEQKIKLNNAESIINNIKNQLNQAKLARKEALEPIRSELRIANLNLKNAKAKESSAKNILENLKKNLELLKVREAVKRLRKKSEEVKKEKTKDELGRIEEAL